MEINVGMLFPLRGASNFGQDLVLTMQESSTLLSLLQNIPKTFNEFKVWTQEVPIHVWKWFFTLPLNHSFTIWAWWIL